MYKNVYENIMNNASQEKIMWDITVDVAYIGVNSYVSVTSTAIIGAYIGSMFPGFGTIGGYLGGLAFGYIFDVIVSDVIREDLKSCIS